jgi:hypothetical protein
MSFWPITSRRKARAGGGPSQSVPGFYAAARAAVSAG